MKIYLPLARPWLAGGVMLAVMETLADFGTVSVFNYDTFTTVIYKTWFGFFSIRGAARMASLLLILIFLILVLEKHFRRKARYWNRPSAGQASRRVPLRGGWKWAVFFFAFCIWTAAFVIPVIQLCIWSWQEAGREFDSRYWKYFLNTIALASAAAFLTVLFSVCLSFAKRHHPDRLTSVAVQAATLGYGIPGTVLAVGIFISCTWVDQRFGDLVHFFSGARPPMILSNTVLAMQLAYLVRFMAVGFTPVESAMHRIPVVMDEAARTLGCTGWNLLRRVQLPLLKSGILSAGLLVFIEVMKEMPITLMTRPFGWETLSVRIFEMTSEGEWKRAALPAVAMVLCGLIPLALLPKTGESPQEVLKEGVPL